MIARLSMRSLQRKVVRITKGRDKTLDSRKEEWGRLGSPLDISKASRRDK